MRKNRHIAIKSHPLSRVEWLRLFNQGSESGSRDQDCCHLTRRSSSAVRLQTLSDCEHCSLTIAQRFVDLSAQPQPMQQYRQLSCYSYHRSFLDVFPSSLGELKAPAPQITVFPKRSQDVMRPLHQQVRRYRSPSLLMCICGWLCPEFLRPGCNPQNSLPRDSSGTDAGRPCSGHRSARSVRLHSSPVSAARLPDMSSGPSHPI
jgi:hypothetical protein